MRRLKLFFAGLYCAGLLLSLSCEERKEASLKAAVPQGEGSHYLAVTPDELSVFVIHHVGDPEAFLVQFKKNAGARKRAGVRRWTMSRDLEQEARFIIHYVVKSKKQLDAFFASPEYESLLQGNESIESSLVWEANNAFFYQGKKRANYSLFKKFPTKDFSVLSFFLKKSSEAFASAGGVAVSLHQSVMDPQVAILHIEADSPKPLRELFRGPVFKDAFSHSGSKNLSKPIVSRNLD